VGRYSYQKICGFPTFQLLAGGITRGERSEIFGNICKGAVYSRLPVSYATCPSQTAGGDPAVWNIAFPLSPMSAGGGGDGPLHIYIYPPWCYLSLALSPPEGTEAAERKNSSRSYCCRQMLKCTNSYYLTAKTKCSSKKQCCGAASFLGGSGSGSGSGCKFWCGSGSGGSGSGSGSYPTVQQGKIFKTN
jgi:hypothetical protein